MTATRTTVLAGAAFVAGFAVGVVAAAGAVVAYIRTGGSTP
jgi:hypothetical protein